MLKFFSFPLQIATKALSRLNGNIIQSDDLCVTIIDTEYGYEVRVSIVSDIFKGQGHSKMMKVTNSIIGHPKLKKFEGKFNSIQLNFIQTNDNDKRKTLLSKLMASRRICAFLHSNRHNLKEAINATFTKTPTAVTTVKKPSGQNVQPTVITTVKKPSGQNVQPTVITTAKKPSGQPVQPTVITTVKKPSGQNVQPTVITTVKKPSGQNVQPTVITTAKKPSGQNVQPTVITTVKKPSGQNVQPTVVTSWYCQEVGMKQPTVVKMTASFKKTSSEDSSESDGEDDNDKKPKATKKKPLAAASAVAKKKLMFDESSGGDGEDGLGDYTSAGVKKGIHSVPTLVETSTASAKRKMTAAEKKSKSNKKPKKEEENEVKDHCVNCKTGCTTHQCPCRRAARKCGERCKCNEKCCNQPKKEGARITAYFGKKSST
jgi:hypothetical protein